MPVVLAGVEDQSHDVTTSSWDVTVRVSGIPRKRGALGMFLKLKPCRFAAVALFPRLSQPYRRHDASLSSPSNLWPLKCTYCGDRRAICMELEGT